MVRLAALVSVALALAAIAEGALAGHSQTPRRSSVGNGAGRAPAISDGVRAAARAAACRVRAFRSAGLDHADSRFRWPQRPAVSGLHRSHWAEWGVYDRPVPEQYQVHNLEHGAVIVHHGGALPPEVRDALLAFFDAEPGYLLIVPRASTKLVPAAGTLTRFPEAGLVVTSWQRRMVCAAAGDEAVAAVRAWARRYRGTGPEGAAPDDPFGRRPRDLPPPVLRAPSPY